MPRFWVKIFLGMSVMSGLFRHILLQMRGSTRYILLYAIVCIESRFHSNSRDCTQYTLFLAYFSLFSVHRNLEQKYDILYTIHLLKKANYYEIFNSFFHQTLSIRNYLYCDRGATILYPKDRFYGGRHLSHYVDGNCSFSAILICFCGGYYENMAQCF